MISFERSPNYYSLTLAAGARQTIRQVGRILAILDISGADTCAFGIDGERPRTLPKNFKIGSRDDAPFSRVEVWNNNAVPIIVPFTISNVEVGSDAGALTAMETHLAAIDQEISGAAAASPAGQLANTICPITPGPGQLLFAASATRTEVEIYAPPSNGAGLIYLGIRSTKATATDKFKVLAAGDGWWSEREKGALYACSSTGAEIVNGKEC